MTDKQTDRHTSDTDEFLKEIVQMNFQRIRAKYALLVTNTLHQLEELRTDVGRFRVYISNFPASRKFENMLFFQQHLRELREASSLTEVFTMLSQFEYWSWENYHLLSAVVEAFGTPAMKDDVKTYKKDLDTFRINTKLCHYVDVIAEEADTDTPPKPDFVRLIVKLKERWCKYTLKCVEDFWESVIEEFSLAPYALIFRDAKPGCICLTFLIPVLMAPWLIIQSKNKVDFFSSLHIRSLTVGEHCVFDLDVTNCGTMETNSEVSIILCSNARRSVGLSSSLRLGSSSL